MKTRISPMQALLDEMSADWQRQRAETQMTLGAFIKALEGVDPTRKLVGIGEPVSYRGYYSDLSFQPSGEIRTVAEVLEIARGCMGRVFEGYKGGDFQMGEQTPLWWAHYGVSSSPRIMGLNLDSNPITLVLAYDEMDA